MHIWGARTLPLELKHVSGGYDGTQVIWDVSLQCRDGTISVIVGPNGAGKTTTLKTVNGLLRPWSGRVYFGGKDITGLPRSEESKRASLPAPKGEGSFPGSPPK